MMRLEGWAGASGVLGRISAFILEQEAVGVCEIQE